MQRVHAKQLYIGTTAERTVLDLGDDGRGALFYDSDTNAFYLWRGSAWQELGSGSGGDADHLVSPDGLIDPAVAVDNAGDVTFVGSIVMGSGETVDGVDLSAHAADANAHHTPPSSATESAEGIIELATTTEVQTGTDTERAVTPAGLRADVPATPAASRGVRLDASGHLLLPAAGDVYPRGDGAGLRQRVDGWRTYTDHFNAFSGYTWASYTGFVIPATKEVTTYPSVLWIYNSAVEGNGRAFAYRAATGGIIALAELGTTEVRTGIRMDDGTNDNYVELWMAPATGGLVALYYRHAVGGSVTGPTQLWNSQAFPLGWYRLRIARSGTTYYYYSSVGDAIIPAYHGALSLGWTATRTGLYHEHLSTTYSSDRCSLFDAVLFF